MCVHCCDQVGNLDRRSVSTFPTALGLVGLWLVCTAGWLVVAYHIQQNWVLSGEWVNVLLEWAAGHTGDPTNWCACIGNITLMFFFFSLIYTSGMTGRVHQTHVHTHTQTWLEAWREALACGAGARVNAPSCGNDAIPSNSTRGIRWYSLNNKLIARWLDESMYRRRVWHPGFLFGMILIGSWPVAGRNLVPCCSRCGWGPVMIREELLTGND